MAKVKAKNDPLIGRTIKGFVRAPKKLMDDMGWRGTPPLCMMLDDGSVLLAQRDAEGNGAGVLAVCKGKTIEVII